MSFNHSNENHDSLNDQNVSIQRLEIQSNNHFSDDSSSDEFSNGKTIKGCLTSWFTCRYFREQHNDIVAYIMLGAARSPLGAWVAVYSVIGLVAVAGYASYPVNKVPMVNLFGHETKLSSVVSTLLTVEGFVNLVLGPVYGYVVNKTTHRTLILDCNIVLFNMCVLILAGIVFLRDECSPNDCPPLTGYCLVLVFTALVFECNLISHGGYLPELSINNLKRIGIQSKQQALGNTFMLATVIISICIGLAADIAAPAGATLYQKMDANGKTAQIASLIAVFFSLMWAIPGIIKMTPRDKPLNYPGVFRTVKLCYDDYSQLSIFYLSYAFFFPGVTALIGLGTTYLQAELGMSGLGLQLLVGLVILVTVPSALACRILVHKIKGIKYAMLLVLCWWAFVMVLPVPFLVTGEDYCYIGDVDVPCNSSNTSIKVGRQPSNVGSVYRYFQAIFWGMGIGMIHPLIITFTAEFVPGGTETAFFGIKTLAAKALAWLPPLLYTVINESNDNPRYAFLSLLPFPIIGITILLFFDPKKAHEQIAHTIHLRQGIENRVVDEKGDRTPSQENIDDRGTDAEDNNSYVTSVNLSPKNKDVVVV